MMGLASEGLGMLFMILFWVVVVAAAVWLVSRLFPEASDNPSLDSGEGQPPPRDSALEIIKQRYARGEITQSEYLHMRNTLRN